MSMRFSYRRFNSLQPVWSLGGGNQRPRPVVLVSILGPTGTDVRRALLDTGADDTVFEESVATTIGLDLSTARTGQCIGASGAVVPVRYAQVNLRLTDGNEFRSWPAQVGFTPALAGFSLLGFAGCLQFFDALFLGEAQAVELTVNTLYPGT